MKKLILLLPLIFITACGLNRNYDAEQHSYFSTLYTVTEALYDKCGTDNIKFDMSAYMFFAATMKNYNKYEGANMEKISNEIYKLAHEFYLRYKTASKNYCEEKLKIILTSLDKAMKASKTRMKYGY